MKLIKQARGNHTVASLYQGLFYFVVQVQNEITEGVETHPYDGINQATKKFNSIIEKKKLTLLVDREIME